MLDMSVFTNVMVFFCPGIPLKGKKNRYLVGFEALLGRKGESFICVLLYKYPPLITKVNRALFKRLEVFLPSDGKFLGCTHFWHPSAPLFSLPRENGVK